MTSMNIISFAGQQQPAGIKKPTEQAINKPYYSGLNTELNQIEQDVIQFSGKTKDNKKAAKELTQKLDALLEEISLFTHPQAVMSWDQETIMPKGGIEMRAKSMGYMAGKSHEMSTSEEYVETLTKLKKPKYFKHLSPMRQKAINKLWDSLQVSLATPTEMVEQMTELGAQSQAAWAEARATDDFSKFAPFLQKQVDFARKQADIIKEVKGIEGPRYDALADMYEPGMTTEKLDAVFANLREEIVPLVHAIQSQNVDGQNALDDSVLRQTFARNHQKNLGHWIAGQMGFDFDRGMIGETTHPFTMGMGSPDDVRFSIRQDKNYLWELVATTMHEGGHAQYEQGLDHSLPSPLNEATSLGIHESQSRLWENQVGRGKSFITYLLNTKLGQSFKTKMEGVNADELYKAVNQSEPSLIRTASDEVTYNLHIMVRYEIEKELIDGDLQVEDVPRVWNEKMSEYLGIEPPNDTEGCLQDIHWSFGAFGYFPTYTMGNLYSAQFFQQAKQEIPDLEAKIEAGELTPLKEWLNEKVHKVGSSELPDEIAERVTGEPLNPQHFVDYLWDKYGELYNIERPNK